MTARREPSIYSLYHVRDGERLDRDLDLNPFQEGPEPEAIEVA
jgi:hypothetical protein